MARHPIRFLVDRGWFRNRMLDLEIKQAQLARTIGLRQPQLSRTLSGHRELKNDEAVSLATALKVPLEEVLKRAGVATPRFGYDMVPVVGSVDASGLVSAREGVSGPRRVPHPAASGDAMAAIIVDDPSSPLNGSVIYYEPTTRLDPNAIGRLAVVEDSTGVRRFGVLQRSYERDRWRLHPVSLAVTGFDVQVAWAAPVPWVKN